MKNESPVTKFRKELTRIMPGYDWTIRRTRWLDTADSKFMEAEGIQSSGFNRLSTLRVIRRDSDGVVEYEVTSSGFGKRSPWLAEYSDATLARALRGLQAHYENNAHIYSKHAADLEIGRKPIVEEVKEG